MQGKLHRYIIIQDLAKKYSHSTYLAAPADKPEHQVVLIVFPSSLFSSQHERDAVLEKAQSLKKLQHTHLVPVLDMGIADDQPFVVRDYLPNQSLRNHLKQLAPERLELSEALTLLLQVGEALAYAHIYNIYHGNIKPENILLNARGQALLTDFTLLKSADAMIRNQTSQEYAFCYQAPEQFAGTCDAYSDQYALACLAYELITGEAPFANRGLTSLIGGQYRYTQPVPLSEMVPDLVPSLEAAVLKALAKDPGERFFDFSLFLEVIRSIVSPPPAFPILRSAASYKQKNLSRFAQLPNAPVIFPSPRKHMAPPIPPHQVIEASLAVSPTESEKAEHVDISAIIDPIAPEQAGSASIFVAGLSATEDDVFPSPFSQNTSSYEEQVTEYEEPAFSLSNKSEAHKPLTRRTLRSRRTLLGLLLVCFLIAALGAPAGFLPWWRDKPNEPIYSKQLVKHEIIPAITNLAGRSFTMPITPLENPQANTTPRSNTTPQANTTPRSNTTPQANTTPRSNTTPQPKTTLQVVPTPTPTPVALQTTTIDDRVIGTGLNQFNYVGGWQSCNPCPDANNGLYDGSNSWDTTTNDYVTFKFSGVQLHFYATIDPGHGIGAVSLDGGSETMIDFYAVNRGYDQLLWTSQRVPAGTHTFKLRTTGNKDPTSPSTSNFTITVDRVDVLG